MTPKQIKLLENAKAILRNVCEDSDTGNYAVEEITNAIMEINKAIIIN